MLTIASSRGRPPDAFDCTSRLDRYFIAIYEMLFSHRGVIRPQRVAAAPCPIPQRPRARRVRCRAASNDGQYGLVLEADGVVMDTHRDGHREAFNRAFSVGGFARAYKAGAALLLGAGDWPGGCGCAGAAGRGVRPAPSESVTPGGDKAGAAVAVCLHTRSNDSGGCAAGSGLRLRELDACDL